MCWYHYIAYFFGGALLANAIAHFVSDDANSRASYFGLNPFPGSPP